MIYLKKLSLTTLAAFTLLSAAYTQKKIYKQVEVKPTAEVVDPTSQSLTYMLPKTTIHIEVEMEKVIKKAGPYYRYSQRYLNLSNVITEDKEEWVIKGVKINTQGTPDESKRYSVFSQGNTSANNLSLTPKGILTGINNPFKYHPSPKKCTKPIPSLENISFDNVSLNEELLYKTSTAAMAQEAANMIYRLRTTRTELLSGELENLPPDGEAYKTVLKEIEKQEKDFVSLFSGKTITATQTEHFELTPDPLSSYANFVLCRFSKTKGLVDAMDITGTPIYLKIDTEIKKQLKNKRTEAPKEPAKNGLFYNIPGSVTIQVVDKNELLLTQSVDMAQYGQVISMSPAILEKEDVVIKVCPVTGALLSVSNEQ